MVKKIVITNRRSTTAVIPITELGVNPVTGTPASPAKTHEVAEYDNWFLQEIENGLTEANDPETRWVSDDEANRSWEKKLTELIKSSLSARELLQKKLDYLHQVVLSLSQTPGTMTQVRVRNKHQITIPARIAASANIKPDDLLEAAYNNGVVTLIPISRKKRKESAMNYAGIAQGTWGKTTLDIDTELHKSRDSWEQ